MKSTGSSLFEAQANQVRLEQKLDAENKKSLTDKIAAARQGEIISYKGAQGILLEDASADGKTSAIFGEDIKDLHVNDFTVNLRVTADIDRDAIVSDPILAAYLEAALWSTGGEGGEDDSEYLDQDFDFEDLDPAVVSQAKSDILEFLSEVGDLVEESGMDEGQLGHDLWLTRNGHGAGFWDRGYDKHIEDGLTKAAHDMGEVNLYVGDDKKIHASLKAEMGAEELGTAPEENPFQREADDVIITMDEIWEEVLESHGESYVGSDKATRDQYLEDFKKGVLERLSDRDMSQEIASLLEEDNRHTELQVLRDLTMLASVVAAATVEEQWAEAIMAGPDEGQEYVEAAKASTSGDDLQERVGLLLDTGLDAGMGEAGDQAWDAADWDKVHEILKARLAVQAWRAKVEIQGAQAPGPYEGSEPVADKLMEDFSSALDALMDKYDLSEIDRDVMDEHKDELYSDIQEFAGGKEYGPETVESLTSWNYHFLNEALRDLNLIKPELKAAPAVPATKKTEDPTPPVKEPKSRGTAPQKEEMREKGKERTETKTTPPSALSRTKPKSLTKDISKSAPEATEQQASAVEAVLELESSVEAIDQQIEEAIGELQKSKDERSQELAAAAADLHAVIEEAKTPVLKYKDQILAIDEKRKIKKVNLSRAASKKAAEIAKKIAAETAKIKKFQAELNTLLEEQFKKHGGVETEQQRVTMFPAVHNLLKAAAMPDLTEDDQARLNKVRAGIWDFITDMANKAKEAFQGLLGLDDDIQELERLVDESPAAA